MLEAILLYLTCAAYAALIVGGGILAMSRLRGDHRRIERDGDD